MAFDLTATLNPNDDFLFQKPSASNSLIEQDKIFAESADEHVFGIFAVNHPLSTMQTKIMQEVASFYADSANLEILAVLIRQSGTISLRLLDWLVTTYSKFNLTMASDDDDTGIYEQYKLVLSRYKRRNFDPFRRCKRKVGDTSVSYSVTFTHDGKELKSTVGQLNFVKWCIVSKVYDYAVVHNPKIDPLLCQRSGDSSAMGIVSAKRHKIEMW